MTATSSKLRELQLSILHAHLAQIEGEMVDACEAAAARLSPGKGRADWDRATWAAYVAEGERQLELTQPARMAAVQEINIIKQRRILALVTP